MLPPDRHAPDEPANTVPATIASTMLDPLIRLHAEELMAYHHVHLYSQVDDDAQTVAASMGSINGYTEWATPDRQPALTFAWDWTYDRSSQRLQAHWSSLRTNLRVVGSAGEDLGDECTRLCVARLMTRACWERVIAEALKLPLAMPPDSRH